MYLQCILKKNLHTLALYPLAEVWRQSTSSRNMEAMPRGFPVAIVRTASSVWAYCSHLISHGKCGALQLITYSHSEVTMGSFQRPRPARADELPA